MQMANNSNVCDNNKISQHALLTKCQVLSALYIKLFNLHTNLIRYWYHIIITQSKIRKLRHKKFKLA